MQIGICNGTIFHFYEALLLISASDSRRESDVLISLILEDLAGGTQGFVDIGSQDTVGTTAWKRAYVTIPSLLSFGHRHTICKSTSENKEFITKLTFG